MNIGLTYTYNETKHNNYVNWLKNNNQDIQVTRLSAEENNADIIRDCDALVLSGGIDIYPRSYDNKDLNYDNAPSTFQRSRDQFEKIVLELAFEKKIPVIGICRGLQLVNTVMGGSLKQDNGEELNKIHWGEIQSGQDRKDRVHKVNIATGTLLHNIVTVDNANVNSAHHQSIDKLGENLLVNSKADDGTIEGIEWEDKSDKSFLLCVQWHPERMFQFGLQNNPLTKEIRDSFINEIQKFKLIEK